MKKQSVFATLVLLAMALLSACNGDDNVVNPITTDVNVLLIQSDKGWRGL